MSYIRNYVLIASALYLLSAIKHYFQFSIFWMPWYALKTTNLFIMYHMERLYAHTKKGVYHNQILGIQTMDFDALRERMSTYGLIRDKLYEIGAYFWYKLSHIFGIQRGNKRNYLALLLTLLFTKRALWVKLGLKIYRHRKDYDLKRYCEKAWAYLHRLNPVKAKYAIIIMVIGIGIISAIKLMQFLKERSNQKLTKESNVEFSLLNQNEKFNRLQNQLGNEIIKLVGHVRQMDQMLLKRQIIDEKGLQQVLSLLESCEKILATLKGIFEVSDELKAIEIYKQYTKKTSCALLALKELMSENWSEEALTYFHNLVHNHETLSDKEAMHEAREILYDYLKKCIEYYDELDEWLIQISEGKRKLHKLIYKKEQAYKAKTLTEHIDSCME